MIRTFEHARKARLNVYLGPLLEVAAGANKHQLHELMLRQQRKEAEQHLRWSSRQTLDKAARREDARSLLETTWQRLGDRCLLYTSPSPRDS